MSQTGKLKTTLVLLALLGSSGSLYAAADDIDQEFDVSPNGTVILDSDSGAIDVATWDRNTVKVEIRNPDNFEVRVEQRGNDVVVVAERDRGLFGGGRSRIGFRLTVPYEYNLDLDTGGGQIEVADISGEVELDTSGGSIKVGKVVDGDVNVDTSGGQITIDDVVGDVAADTSGGNISIGNVTGDASADTSGGRIRIGDVGGDMYADTSGGNIEVGRGGGRVDLDTSGGSIRAAWSTGPLVADTSGGNIYLAGGDASIYADTSGGSIEINGGNGMVTADTSGGNIRIQGVTGPVSANTSGGRIEVDLSARTDPMAGSVDMDSSGGDLTLRLPSDISVTIDAEISVSRRARGDYRVYTDFPLTIQEDDGDIIARGDINGGGDTVRLETSNGDINILNASN